MFASSARTPFGGNAAGFSSTTNTQPSPFGHNQMFGAATNPTFGTSTPAFGQPATPMFGAPQQPLFTSSTPAFGATNQNAFGSNALFGQQNQPQSNTNLFGATSNSAFGQQNKNTGFSFPSSQPGGLFGQTAPTQQPNLFQPSTSTNIFGTSGFSAQAQTGTPVKFNPVTGTDSMQKGGSSQMINTKHHSITCMKEYETKSFEELRYEDYLVNRKGPQASAGAFGASNTPFGAVASSSQSIFGQTENKPAFGAPNGFPTPAFGMGNQASTSQAVFGKPSTGFGSAITTTNSFGFTNTPSTNIFGSSATTKPFGIQNAQPSFGAQPSQQTATTFGTGPFFGQQSTSQPSFFTKPVQSGFPAPSTGTFSFGQTPVSTPATNLFQPSKPSTGFSLPTTNAFGQQNTSFGGFGSFSKPAQSTFGTSNQPATPFGGISNPLFGPSANTKSTFGTGTNLFAGSNSQAQNNTFALPSQQAPQITLSAPSQAEELRNMSNMTDPYGFSPHLDSLPSIVFPHPHYTTNPKDLENLLKAQTKNPTSIPTTKKVRVTSPPPQTKWIEFDTAYDEEQDFSEVNFKKNISTKQLQLKRVSLKKPEPIVVYQDGFMVGGKEASNACAFLPSAFKKPTIDIPLIEAPAVDKASMTDEVNTNAQDAPSISQISHQNNTESVKTTSSTQSLSTIDTCGIICTRPEYYTIPPLNEISQYKNSDGTCMIKGFTIGRIAYGNVFFPDVMDVSNLNIDQLVHFRYKEISIYGENDEKPPVGEGLNRRAQVTLDRVYPRKESNKEELETDPEVLIADNFAEVLRLASNRANSSFVDYRPETGSWVFAVEHFSKYGLSDTEEKQCREEMKKQQQHKEFDETNVSVEKIKELSESSIHSINTHGLGGLSKDNLSYAGAYIHEPSEIEFNINGDHITMNPNIDSMMCTFYEESCTFSTLNHEENKIQIMDLTNYDHSEEIKVSNSRIIPIPKLFKLFNPSGHIPFGISLVPKKGLMDAAVFKGRSFKVGWAKGFTFATTLASERNGFHNFTEDMNMQYTVILSDISQPELENQMLKDSFLEIFDYFMNIALSESKFECQNGIPFVKIAPQGNILKKLSGLFSKYLDEYKNDVKLNYYTNVFNLCDVFWGGYDSKDIYAVRRRFESWLENVCAELVRTDLVKYGSTSNVECSDTIKKILILLSGHKINAAAKLALESNLPQLGMLISQLTANQNLRNCVNHQMHLWYESMAMDYIEKDIIKLYFLVCGVPFYNDVNVCEDFDWIRSLGIHFWYLLPSSKPLTHTIYMYEQAFSTDCYAEKPLSINRSVQTWDIYYHLMKLYCNNQLNLDDVLSPATHTNDLIDFRLSWLLQQTLLSVGVGLLSEHAQVHINTIFSSQLEQLGYYKWSIYVLLFLPDVNLRKELVMGVLDRNITDDKDIENDLVLDLKIPIEWIHYVKALKSNQLNKYWASYRHLALSQRWQECHDTIFNHLLSSLVCNRDFGLLKYVLEDASVGKEHIYRWKTNGGLLIEFINYLNINSNKLKSEDLKTLQRNVFSLASRLKYFPSSNSFELMIISEISKFCSAFYHVLLGQLSYDNSSYMKHSAEFIQQLVMPFDYKFEEISKSILNAYT